MSLPGETNGDEVASTNELSPLIGHGTPPPSYERGNWCGRKSNDGDDLEAAVPSKPSVAWIEKQVQCWEDLQDIEVPELIQIVYGSTWGQAAGTQAVDDCFSLFLREDYYKDDPVFSKAKGIMKQAGYDVSPEQMLRRWVYWTVDDTHEHDVRGKPYNHASQQRLIYSDSMDDATGDCGDDRWMVWTAFWGRTGWYKGMDYTIHYLQRDAALWVAQATFAVGSLGGVLFLVGAVLFATIGGWDFTHLPVDHNPATMLLSTGVTIILGSGFIAAYIHSENLPSALKHRRTNGLHFPLAGMQVAVVPVLLVNFTILYAIIIPIYGYSHLYQVHIDERQVTTVEQILYDILFFTNLLSTAVFIGLLVFLLLYDPASSGLKKSELPSFSYCPWCDKSHSGHRRYHCHKCHKCVTGFDHHCDFLNQCIGEHNYREWFWMVASMSLMSITEVIVTISAIVTVVMHDETGTDARTSTGEVLFYFLAAICFGLQCFLIYLSVNLLQLHLSFRVRRVSTGRWYSTLTLPQPDGTQREYAEEHDQCVVISILQRWALDNSLRQQRKLEKALRYTSRAVRVSNKKQQEEQVYLKLMANANARQQNRAVEFVPPQRGCFCCCCPGAPQSKEDEAKSNERLMWMAGQDVGDSEHHVHRTPRPRHHSTSITGLHIRETLGLLPAPPQPPGDVPAIAKIATGDQSSTAAANISAAPVVLSPRVDERVIFPELMERFKITSVECSRYHEGFTLLDQDGDGFITAPDLAKVYKGLGISQDQADLEALIHKTDENKDGRVNFSEFLAMMVRAGGDTATDSEADLVQVYRQIAGDEPMTSEFLKGRLMQYDMRAKQDSAGTVTWPQECDQEWTIMWNFFDEDKDSVLSEEEFVKAIKTVQVSEEQFRTSHSSSAISEDLQRSRAA